MPYPNEHACRLREPGDFKPDSFRRTSRKHDGKTYDIISGKLKGEDTMTEQAYRYGKKTWSAAQARAHCEEHDGIEFEPAKESKGIEHRTFDLDQIVVERRADGQPPIIRGHAAVFNLLSESLGYGFRERIQPGAFTKTLQEADVRALFNHDSNLILGRTKSGTLRVTEDAVGLAFEIDPPDTSYANDLLVSIERGDVDQASFAFSTVKDEMSTEGEETIRTLVEVHLYDVSPVTFPAYPQTDVSVRALLESALAVLNDGGVLTEEQERALQALEPSRADAHSVADGGREPGGRPLAMLRRRLELAERRSK